MTIIFEIVAAPEVRDATTLVDLYPEDWSETVPLRALYKVYRYRTRWTELGLLNGSRSTTASSWWCSWTKRQVLHNGALPSALVRGHGLGGRRHLRVTRGDSSCASSRPKLIRAR